LIPDYFIWLIIGIAFIAFAMLVQKRLTGRLKLDIKIERLGITLLKTDAFGLVLLVGIALIVLGPISFFLNYEKDQSGSEARIAAMQSEMAAKDEAIKMLKNYDLRLNLLFPESDQANPFSDSLRVKAYVRKAGELSDALYEHIRIDKGMGGIVLYFEKLGLGDKLYVVVEQGSRRWRSDDMVTPGAFLRMQRL
jgi:hypothetical protein